MVDYLPQPEQLLTILKRKRSTVLVTKWLRFNYLFYKSFFNPQLVSDVKIDQIERLKEYLTERNNIDDTKHKDCYETLRMFAPKELLENRITYHSDCYKIAQNKTNIQRLKKLWGMWKCT